MFHNISYANPAAARGHLTTNLGLADIRSPPPRCYSCPSKHPVTTKVRKLEPRTAQARLDTPTDLPADGVREISAALNALIAATFALYV